MATAPTKPVTNAVYRIIFYQLLLLLGFIVMLFLLKGKQSGWSALAGGLAYWLPTFIFSRVVATCVSARAIARFVVAFFGGEVVKLILSGVLFLLAINYLHAQILYAVIGLMVAIAAFWLASIACLYRAEVKL